MSMQAASRHLYASAPVRHVSHVAAGSNLRSVRGGSGGGHHVGVGAVRPVVLALAKLLLLPLASAAPMTLWEKRGVHGLHEVIEEPMPADSPNLWAYLGVAIALVLLGGAFAGLTIALMGQDETYLQVIATSGEGSERKNAQKVLKLLKNGKHWVLVTLLLSNVITNETLPIVLDRSLGGGWPAVVASTVLIVIFGEIAPQSVCVRYGLAIGAFMSPGVLFLMWIMCPVAWPTAKLLDWLLGEDHGTMYKKAGLKTLVQLHKTLGTTPGERLMEDEVTIISSVLDLKEKPVGDIMTPMGDVFTMSADTVLDERMMDIILSQGYSRIPIYAPENHRNFIGMLLVKILITYDPDDCKRVQDFALATLPETAPYTSCLDIINFFQEGKSHMVLVSDFPGQDKGALGVVTLEDVIEELIGEEIIDESDVFVDVHKAIRRMAPAPKTRFNKYSFTPEPFVGNFSDSEYSGKEFSEDDPLLARSSSEGLRKTALLNGHGRGHTTLLMRRRSSTASESARDGTRPVAVRSSTEDMKKHLAHLGPSNAASRPRATKFTSVKIKPGVSTIPENGESSVTEIPASRSQSEDIRPVTPVVHDEDDILNSGKAASDGVAAVQSNGYGTMSPPPPAQGPSNERMSASEASKLAEMHTDIPRRNSNDAKSVKSSRSSTRSRRNSPQSTLPKYPDKLVWGNDVEDQDGVGELPGTPSGVIRPRQATRSGSITELMVDAGGIQKVVLETTSSSSSEDPEDTASARQLQLDADEVKDEEQPEQGGANGEAHDKKRRKKRGKRRKHGFE